MPVNHESAHAFKPKSDEAALEQTSATCPKVTFRLLMSDVYLQSCFHFNDDDNFQVLILHETLDTSWFVAMEGRRS